VTFDREVTLAGGTAAAFTLIRTGDGAAVTFTAFASLVGGVTVATLANFSGASTQFGSLADGRYTLTALAAQVSFAGITPLDGDGDGFGGDDYVLNSTGASGVFRLLGDGNGDARVDVADLGLFAGTYLKVNGDPGYLTFFDFNNDGRVDVADLGQFASRYLTTLP
jgi:hypothetical protein